jgi:hypothetical protein
MGGLPDSAFRDFVSEQISIELRIVCEIFQV